MTHSFLLIEQYNKKSIPLVWSDFFQVLCEKDKYHVAVSYTPDDYLKLSSNSCFSKKRVEKRIGTYNFDDDSFIWISKKLNKKNFQVKNFYFEKNTDDYINEAFGSIGYSEIANNFSENLYTIIKDNPDIQFMNKVSFINKRTNERIDVSRYGVVRLFDDTISEQIRDVLKSIIL